MSIAFLRFLGLTRPSFGLKDARQMHVVIAAR
jgi:hypothetical protein